MAKNDQLDRLLHSSALEDADWEMLGTPYFTTPASMEAFLAKPLKEKRTEINKAFRKACGHALGNLMRWFRGVSEYVPEYKVILEEAALKMKLELKKSETISAFVGLSMWLRS